MPKALMAKSSKGKATEQAQKHPAEVARQHVPTSPGGAVLALQRKAGNHAVNHSLGQGLRTLSSTSGLLQRKCACGNNTVAGGECEECGKKQRLGLQTKLKVNEPGDVYEQEADRIADQVMAAPAHPAISTAPPHIQRFSGQSKGQMDAAPASVDQALSSPGRPLEPALRQDMEQRFGHDFSQVRVHFGAAAELSARDVNAHAYTVGHNMVFGAGWFAPGTRQGRRLIAHELAHVVQQSEPMGIRVDQGNKKRGLLISHELVHVFQQGLGSARGRTTPSDSATFEGEVNRAAAAVDAGNDARVTLTSPPGAVQRQMEGHGESKGSKVRTPTEITSAQIARGPTKRQKVWKETAKQAQKPVGAKGAAPRRVEVATTTTSRGVRAISNENFRTEFTKCRSGRQEAGLPQAFLCINSSIARSQVAMVGSEAVDTNVIVDGHSKKGGGGEVWVVSASLPWSLTTGGFLDVDITEPKMLRPYADHERGHREIAVQVRDHLAPLLQAELERVLPTKSKPQRLTGKNWGQQGVNAIVRQIDAIIDRYEAWWDELSDRADADWDAQDQQTLSSIAAKSRIHRPATPRLKEEE